MASEIFFTTQRDQNETTFTVHPARASTGFLKLIGIVLLCSTIFGFFNAAPILTCFAIALVGGIYFVFRGKDRQRPADRGDEKDTVNITVNRAGIRMNDQKFYPADDIAEFLVQAPNAPALASNTVVFGGSGVMGLSGAFAAAGMQSANNAGRVIGARIAARSVSLMIRKRSHSSPVPIVRGLTSEVAQALMNDILEAMR
jgi:hypothetical protein